jgi:hypothetical protein
MDSLDVEINFLTSSAEFCCNADAAIASASATVNLALTYRTKENSIDLST